MFDGSPQLTSLELHMASCFHFGGEKPLTVASAAGLGISLMEQRAQTWAGGGVIDFTPSAANLQPRVLKLHTDWARLWGTDHDIQCQYRIK